MTLAMAGRNPALAGIGLFVREGSNVAFEIGWPEVERDTAWAHRVIEAWGIERGDHVLLTARNSEGPWFGPLVTAFRAAGVVFSNAEPYSWDARRVTTMLDYLPIKAILGLSGETADALLADDRAAGLLREVPTIWARRDALDPLRGAGLLPAEMAMLGPAFAVECPARTGLHLDHDEWRISSGSSGLELSVVGERVYRGREIALRSTGTVDEAPCACGLPGSRIRID